MNEYASDPLLDEEVNEAILKNDPNIIWAMIGTLATMDTKEYAINRSAIKAKFSGVISIALLDKAVNEKRQPEDIVPKSKETPPNEVANSILAKHDVINVDDTIYWYDSRKWVMTRASFLNYLALQADGEKTSSMNRRKEIASFISSKIYKRDHKWRQIEMYEVPVANGVVDVRTMEVFQHRKEDYIQTCIPWEYKPTGQCPQLMRCLDTYFGGDHDGDAKIAALQEFFGYCLMPHARYKKALFCLGESDCGKSTIPFLLRILLGAENCTAVAVEDMNKPRERAPLLGKLVNLLTELTSDAMIADGGFKTLVSTEEPILFDVKWGGVFMDIPICKHVIVGNSKPAINDRSNGTYRRLLLLHFKHVIPQSEQDTTIWDKLRCEVDGILSWALEGAQRLHRNGGRFTDPGAKEVSDYKREQNPFSQFVAEKCDAKPEESAFLHDIRTQFENWYGQKVRPQYLASLIRAADYKIDTERSYVGPVRGFLVRGVQIATDRRSTNYDG